MKNTKFNIIDLIIILLVIAIAFVGIYLYISRTSSNPVDTTTTSIVYKIEVGNITKNIADSFKIGDIVSLGKTTSGTGIIQDVEITEYRTLVTNSEDGEFVWTTVPGKYMAHITIFSDVIKTDMSYMSGSEQILIGKEMPFNGKGFGIAEGCYIVDLKEAVK